MVRLPEEKLRRIQSLVGEWRTRKACRKRELGHLQHAATQVAPVRRLIELLSAFKNKDRWVRLGDSTRSDLAWWLTFMEGWNGVYLMPSVHPVPGPLVTDVRLMGLQSILGNKWHGMDIAAKELLPIVLALVVWGKRWAGKRVECLCDSCGRIECGPLKGQDTNALYVRPTITCGFMHPTYLGPRIQQETQPHFRIPAGGEREPTALPQTLINLTVREQPDRP